MGRDAATRARASDDIVRLAHRALEPTQLAQALTKTLNRAVPFEGACLLTLDPATLLPTHEIVENGLPASAMPRLTDIELRELDFNKFNALARQPRQAASLSAATEGHLDRSVRQRELRRPNGFGDELRIALSTATGTWGALTLLRESSRPDFSPAEVNYAASLSHVIADGLRRSALINPSEPTAMDPRSANHGLLILTTDNTVQATNTIAERWLDELHEPRAPNRDLPIVVTAVASRARSLGSSNPSDEHVSSASARVQTRAGRWILVHGSILDHGDGDIGHVAIILEATQPQDLAPLIADAYGLTPRERRVTELVARGYATNEIAARLHLSAYTVQDHLKSIFDKTGVASRGELVAHLFFEHYTPRLNSSASTD